MFIFGNLLSPHRRTTFRSCVCVVVALTSFTGCRSSMPKFNMFGFKREPSPEALAGVGPTSTYPLSPSAGISAEAIASAAAGTGAPSGVKPQTSNIASAAPSYGQPPVNAPTTPATNASLASQRTPVANNAASAANGFYGQSAPTAPTTTPASNLPASYANATGKSGGFTYGQNTNASAAASTATAPAPPAGFTPNKSAAGVTGMPAYAQAASASTPPKADATPAYSAVPGYPMPGGITPSVAPVKTPAPTALPPTSSIASLPPSTTPPASSSAASFAVPPMNGDASAFAPASTAGFAVPPVGPGLQMPGMTSAPAAANVASLPPARSMTNPMAPVSKASATSGYKPGSTAGATGYPAGDYPQSGTFYR